MKRLNTKGFTIIELLIATVIFSLVLLIITGAIIQFSKIYYKGVIVSRTNQVADTIIRDIASTRQYSVGQNVKGGTPGNYQSLCIGSRRYTYILHTPLSANQHVLVADRVPNGQTCDPNTDAMTRTLVAGETELIGDNMRLVSLSADNAASSSTGIYPINVRVAYGVDTDMRDNNTTDDIPFDSCATISLGGQFCAVTDLSTTVVKRLK